MLNTFADVEIRLDEHRASRFWFTPFGELDFIDLPYGIRHYRHVEGAHNGLIEFDCDDGITYTLSGTTPNASDTWRIEASRRSDSQ